MTAPSSCAAAARNNYAAAARNNYVAVAQHSRVQQVLSNYAAAANNCGPALSTSGETTPLHGRYKCARYIQTEVVMVMYCHPTAPNTIAVTNFLLD